MQINPINFNLNFQKNNVIKKQEKSENINQQYQKGIIPTTAQALSFMGGKSMSLKETKAQIDELGSYPPDIKELIEQTIKDGNPDNKTLIDIHRDKYSMLNQLETLDEIKEVYPEFEDVLSDSQVMYKEGSFIDDVKANKIGYFDSDKDVAVQLLQMYWGDGFSLSDLKNEFAGRNIHGVFEKLNIPRVDKVYGHYLKFSDKDYNARFTASMSERLKEVERKKIEKKEGVYIPRGPLTPEHKENISRGLIKYYSEHPERIAEMSARHLEYYEQNPEESERMSQVTKRAWTYREATSVKKAISKFLKKKELSDDELISMNKNKDLAEFWMRNPWAKENFSKCMKKSWARQEELRNLGLIYEPIYVAHPIPTTIIREVEKESDFPAGTMDEDISVIIEDLRDTKRRYQTKTLTTVQRDMAEGLVSDYFRSHLEASQLMTNTLDFAIIKAVESFKTKYKNSNGQKCPYFEQIFKVWENKVANKKLNNIPIKANEMKDIYSQMMTILVRGGDIASAKELDRLIEENCPKVKRMSVDEMVIQYFKIFDKLIENQ